MKAFREALERYDYILEDVESQYYLVKYSSNQNENKRPDWLQINKTANLSLGFDDGKRGNSTECHKVL